MRYGYRINKNEPDPYKRVEYIYDAETMTPAFMDFSAQKFNYGSWENEWFIKNNKPCMLKYDGTVDYYLNPNNYSQKEDSTNSDVANTSYGGNAMAQIPLCYVKRYEEDIYEYEIISNVKYDEDYYAYAHTRTDGSIGDYFYWSLFAASGSTSQFRSIANQSLVSTNFNNAFVAAKNNGTLWHIWSWSQRELLRTLLILLGKSTNTQSIYGNGNCRGGLSILSSGTLKDKGQFYGANNNTTNVKVFHVEDLWGNMWIKVAGIFYIGGKFYVKMTPEDDGYSSNSYTGYINTNIGFSGKTNTYIKSGNVSDYGFLPTTVSGSGTTYYCDNAWFANGTNLPMLGGGCTDLGVQVGMFTFSADHEISYTYTNVGYALSCEQKK